MSDSHTEPMVHSWIAPTSRMLGGQPARAISWSWRLGSIVGIPIRVHATFWLLLLWVAISHVLQGHGAAAISAGVGLILSIFACVVLHELSHALVAKRFGIRTRDITLLPIGGVANLERMPERPSQELIVALAGPSMSLALAGALWGMLTLLHVPTGFDHLQVVGGPFVTQLMWFNVMLAGFNLLPAFPMDGGRILRAALAMRMSRSRATEIAARIGQAMAVLLGIWGFFFNPMLVIIAAFVWIGAKGEASLVELQSALSGMPVQQAMITEFRVLAPNDPISRGVKLTLAGFQQDFPVLDGGRLVGIVTHANVLEGLAKHGPDAAVERVMQRDVATAAPNDLIQGALERLQAANGRALVVVRDAEVVGLVTLHHIGEILTMGKALRGSRAGRDKSGAASVGVTKR